MTKRRRREFPPTAGKDPRTNEWVRTRAPTVNELACRHEQREETTTFSQRHKNDADVQG